MEMNGAKRVVAFIPARGGSRGIPLKNIAVIGGQPLIYWVARAASECRGISEVCIATENRDIRTCVEGLALDRVHVVDRSAPTATDDAASESALLEFAREREFDILVFMQATSPLVTSRHIDAAIDKFLKEGFDSLLTVVRTKRFLWKEHKGLVAPQNYDPALRPRRQDWEGQLVENGALYITSRKNLLDSGLRLSGRIGAYEMPAESYCELDEPEDWTYLDQVLNSKQRRRGDLTETARKVKMFCADVDGTLTDGGMYYSEDGEAMKRFNTRDAFGMRLLRDQGVAVGMITAEDSDIVRSRARKLKIDEVHLGIQDKEPFVEQLLAERGISWEEFAYIGDDMNDLEVIRRAGLSACPHDATSEIRMAARYVCLQHGGQGAVRELCDLILSARKGSSR